MKPAAIAVLGLLIATAACSNKPPPSEGDANGVKVYGKGTTVRELADQHCEQHDKLAKYVGQIGPNHSAYECVDA